MPTALVTGATGFLGSRLVPLLQRVGWTVRALVRDPGRARVPHGVDLEDPASLDAAFRGPALDAVFHLGAWYEIGVTDRAKMERVNALGTRAILDAARKHGARRVVHCSTVGVYGDCRGAVRDEGWYDPVSVAGLHYTASKRLAHEAAMAENGVDVVVVSPASIFGEGDRSIIATLLRYLVRGWLKIGFYRTTRLGFVHVDDVARALLLAWEHGRRGRDYIVVDRTLSLDEVLSGAARLAGKSPPWFWLPNSVIRLSWPISPVLAPLFGQGPWVLKEAIAMMDGVALEFDGKRARAELGFTPSDFDARMAETVRWFQQQR
jgi:dihydroflavonol-4-reductase